jgi:hypothetical protein
VVRKMGNVGKVNFEPDDEDEDAQKERMRRAGLKHLFRCYTLTGVDL